jgi:hypothetical protein
MHCTICNRELALGDFYPSVATRCKDCHKARMKHLSLIFPRYQERDRERAPTKERRIASREITKRWRAEHPEAYRAQNALNNAVRDGKINKEACRICATTENVHAHHKDYSKPLDVKWLCAKCHHRIHATFPEFGGHYEAAE